MRGGLRQLSNGILECKGNKNVLGTTSSLLWSVHPVPSSTFAVETFLEIVTNNIWYSFKFYEHCTILIYEWLSPLVIFINATVWVYMLLYQLLCCVVYLCRTLLGRQLAWFQFLTDVSSIGTCVSWALGPNLWLTSPNGLSSTNHPNTTAKGRGRKEADKGPCDPQVRPQHTGMSVVLKRRQIETRGRFAWWSGLGHSVVWFAGDDRLCSALWPLCHKSLLW